MRERSAEIRFSIVVVIPWPARKMEERSSSKPGLVCSLRQYQELGVLVSEQKGETVLENRVQVHS